MNDVGQFGIPPANRRSERIQQTAARLVLNGIWQHIPVCLMNKFGNQIKNADRDDSPKEDENNIALKPPGSCLNSVRPEIGIFP